MNIVSYNLSRNKISDIIKYRIVIKAKITIKMLFL